MSHALSELSYQPKFVMRYQCMALYCMGPSIAVVIQSLEAWLFAPGRLLCTVYTGKSFVPLGSGPLLGGSVIGGSTVVSCKSQWLEMTQLKIVLRRLSFIVKMVTIAVA